MLEVVISSEIIMSLRFGWNLTWPQVFSRVNKNWHEISKNVSIPNNKHLFLLLFQYLRLKFSFSSWKSGRFSNLISWQPSRFDASLWEISASVASSLSVFLDLFSGWPDWDKINCPGPASYFLIVLCRSSTLLSWFLYRVSFSVLLVSWFFVGIF